MKRIIATAVFLMCTVLSFAQEAGGKTVIAAAKEVKRYKVDEAKQAVAVDKQFFYVINNSTITKHRKSDGVQVGMFDGRPQGVLTHMNSGVVLDGKLYCASSNYPEEPMFGSIEIFDVATMQHAGNHSFGIGHGSVAWIDEHDGFWWVGFAQYTGKGGSEGKDTRWTTVVKYTKDWQEKEAWAFPKQLIAEFTPKSNSGAAWGKDGFLYCTGHDKTELYVMKIPEMGATLQHLKTITTTIAGQGIAIDRTVNDRLLVYGISRADNVVSVCEVQP